MSDEKPFAAETLEGFVGPAPRKRPRELKPTRVIRIRPAPSSEVGS